MVPSYSPNPITQGLIPTPSPQHVKLATTLPEVVLGFLQPLHPVLDLQVVLRLLKMVPKLLPMPKNMGFLACFRNIFGHPERHDFPDFFF